MRITRKEILARLKDRILVMDGAMGTIIQMLHLDNLANGRSVGGNLDMLNIADPEGIARIHKLYIEAGAEIITTNTFNGTYVSQQEYECSDKVYQINFQGAQIARRAAEEEGLNFFKRKSCGSTSAKMIYETASAKSISGSSSVKRVSVSGLWKKEWGPARAVVAGSMGPTSKSLSLAQQTLHLEAPLTGAPLLETLRQKVRSISFDELVQSYMQQAEALIDGGVDVLLVESIYDGLNAKAALYAISKVQEKRKLSAFADGGCNFAELDIPVMISATINSKNGCVLAGQDVHSLFMSLRRYNPLSFGLNCCFGAKGMIDCIRDISEFAGSCAISACPSAGLPDNVGTYPENPEFTASCIREMAASGNAPALNIAGGCCGTTPEHIAAIASALEGCSPRHI